MRGIPNFVMLRAFEAAARLESFTRAAEELHLTQSAVSHQVRGLEQHFGRELFVRRNRRVELTSEGRRLLNSLSSSFATIEKACKDITGVSQSQTLSVHSAPSFATKWLGPILPEFMQMFPDITIHLSSSASLIDLTRLSEIDVAISYGAAFEGGSSVITPLGYEKITPMCSPKLLASNSYTDEKMQSLTLIDSQLSRVAWADWFALNGMQLPARARPSFDRAALAISAAVDGVGIALESTRLAERELADGTLVEVGPGRYQSFAKETHFLSYRQIDAANPKVKVFRDWLFARAGVET